MSVKITEYRCLDNLNLYDSPECQDLATQAAKGRHLRLLSSARDAIAVYLCEDGYTAWLPQDKLAALATTPTPYQAPLIDREAIARRLPGAIAFIRAAMAQPNYYLWGGTVAPNYDCSGLIQAAFSSVGVWLPRNSYQQADFTQPVSREDLLPGDLIFFALHDKVNHVALYLGNNAYIHSSGKEMGRNGIGIDELREDAHVVSRAYYQHLWGFGRVMSGYVPTS